MEDISDSHSVRTDLPIVDKKKPHHSRRNNSTSTMHIKDSLSHPDSEAIIVAVANQLQKLIFQGENHMKKLPISVETELVDGAKKLRIANENETENVPSSNSSFSSSEIPSNQAIAKHLNNIFTTAQCSVDCTIVCLIYIQRLLKISGLHLTNKNWKSLVATGMLLASKVQDDLSMVNADFAVFLPYSVDQINTWERQFLAGLRYDVRVSASEYTKKYFDLREQVKLSNGLGPAPTMMDINEDQVLDLESAQKLEVLSSQAQKRVDEMKTKTKKRRQL